MLCALTDGNRPFSTYAIFIDKSRFHGTRCIKKSSDEIIDPYSSQIVLTNQNTEGSLQLILVTVIPNTAGWLSIELAYVVNSSHMTNSKSDNQRMRNDWDSRAQVNALHYNSPSRKPGEYDQFFSNGEEFVADEFEALIKNLNLDEDSQALEIGCGIGRMVRPLLKWFGTVNGIDVSPVMIDEAIKLSSGPEYSNLHFQPSDGSSIPLLDDSQDFIFSTGVLTHLPSADVLQQYMHEMRRVLTAGGVFKIEVPIQEGSWKLFGIVVPRKLAPLIPKFVFKLARRMTIKNPMKRNDTYMGVSFSRAKLESMGSTANLKTEFVSFPEGSDHTVWLVGSRA